MSRVRLHAWIGVVILGLALLGAKSTKPLVVAGRPATKFERIPLELDDWTGVDARFDDLTYELLPMCSLLLRYYERDDLYAPVELAIVYGTDLGDFHQPEFCLESQGLQSVEKSVVRIAEADGTSFEAVGLIMEGAYDRRAFVFWFSSQGATSTFLGDYKVKVLLNRLRAGKIEPSALVRLSTQVLDGDEEALDLLVDFAEQIVPYLEEEFAAGAF